MIRRGTRAGGKLPSINVHGLCTCTSDRTTPTAGEDPDGGTILHALITALLGRRRVLRWPSKGASTSREASPRLQAAITHGQLMWQVATTCARRRGRGRKVYRNRKESVGICSVSSCAHGLALACLLSVPGSNKDQRFISQPLVMHSDCHRLLSYEALLGRLCSRGNA